MMSSRRTVGEVVRRAISRGWVALLLAGCATLPLAGYRGPITDHFDGEHFHNIQPFQEQAVEDVIAWQFARGRGEWRRENVPPAPPPPRRVGGRSVHVTFVNHATVLIQMDDLNILTDPVFSERLGAVPWVGPHRFRPPGIRFEDLPPIDIVLLSHDHYDHFDIPTLQRLERTFHPKIITGLGNGALLRSAGIGGGQEIDWWQAAPVADGVHVRAVPTQHWSGRTLSDHCRRLWAGFVIEGRRDTVFFAGDTGWGRFYDLIHRRYARFRLAILPIAPFIPRWYMHRKHQSPADAVHAAQLLHAASSIPIHWGTFELGDDAQHEAVDSLNATIAELPARCRPGFAVLNNGGSLDVPAITDPEHLMSAADSSCVPEKAESRRMSW
jgi:L-ascorbate metabolism protein UlaG (beta-lactamase superfamily)